METFIMTHLSPLFTSGHRPNILTDIKHTLRRVQQSRKNKTNPLKKLTKSEPKPHSHSHFTHPQCTLTSFPTSSASSFLFHCSVFCYFHSHTQFTVSAIRDPQLSSTLVTPTRTRVDSLLDSASPSTLPMAVSSSTDQLVASLMDGS